MRFAAIIVVLILGQLAQAPATFDLSADFSFATIPTKFGNTGIPQLFLAPDQFRVDTQSDRVDMKCDSTGSIGFWHPAVNNGARARLLIPTLLTTPRSSRRWAAKAGQASRRSRDGRQHYRPIQPGAVYRARGWNL